jgi:hypothetical protein
MGEDGLMSAADETTESSETTKSPESPEASVSTPPADDVRDKFKQALARKRGQQADAVTDAEGRGTSKIHDAHGPAGGNRMFRRKAGG